MTQQHKSNDTIDAKWTVNAGCKAEFEVEVSSQACNDAYQEAIKAIRKQVVLPGFRKGKAPESTILKHYQPQVENEWRERVARFGVNEAVRLSEVFPWSSEKLEPPRVESLSKEEGAKLKFQFEKEPDAPTLERDKLDLPPLDAAPIDDKQIEEKIEELRNGNATFEVVEDKVIAKGDPIRIDVESLEKDPPEKLIQDERIEVRDGDAAEWLRKLVTGKKAGDVVDGQSKPDKGASEEAKASFKSIKCRVTIVAVEKKVPATDEKLFELTGVKSINELKDKARNFLTQEEQNRAQAERSKKLWEMLTDKYDFDIPTSMYNAEKRHVVAGMVQAMKEGRSDDEIIQNESEIESVAEKRAKANLVKFFIARKVCTDQQCHPTDQEIRDTATQMMIFHGAAQARQGASNEEMFAQFQQHAFLQLLHSKAESYLLGASS